MTEQEKGPFVNMAKNAKAGKATAGERYTTLGVSFSDIDKQKLDVVKKEQDMNKEIADLVRSSYLNNSKFACMCDFVRTRMIPLFFFWQP